MMWEINFTVIFVEIVEKKQQKFETTIVHIY